MQKLSVVYAARNEEGNLGESIRTIKNIANEIIVVDEESFDKTREIAENLGAKVFIELHHAIFHITKQRALNLAGGGWILQLDADERVTPELAKEIQGVINLSEKEIEKGLQLKYKSTKYQLLLKHQLLIEKRDGKIGIDSGKYAGFFIPRRNYFLGKFLKYGGVYPDGVIRLVKKGKAHFPCKSVHEQIVVEGKVGWLVNPLLHYDSPNIKRYLERNSEYINLMVDKMKKKKIKKNIINSIDYMFIKPIYWLMLTQIRHKGILDGWRGFVFSFFSALRFPRAYLRYIRNS